MQPNTISQSPKMHFKLSKQVQNTKSEQSNLKRTLKTFFLNSQRTKKQSSNIKIVVGSCILGELVISALIIQHT